jgi:hypothetical protein
MNNPRVFFGKRDSMKLKWEKLAVDVLIGNKNEPYVALLRVVFRGGKRSWILEFIGRG